MKLRILTLITLLALLITSLTACLVTPKDNGENTTAGDTGTTETPANTTPVDVRVYALNGTTGFGMAKMMNDVKNGAFTTENYTFTVQTDASLINAALINGDVDIAALPTNAASVVYNATQGGVKILAVNTLGCLYLLTKEGTTVTSLNDLKGKTVYTPAQNPSMIFKAICEKNGLTIGTGADQVNIDSSSYAEPAALRTAVAGGTVDIAVLPEPMVTMAISGAKQQNITYTNAMDLTAEWNKVYDEGSLVQGCVVVRTAFLEQNPTAVANFLTAYQSSIEFLTTNTAEASQMIVDAGIFAQAAVAEKAIPKCNVCYLAGADMKAAMEVYLGVLLEIDATKIGGKVPDANFYYNAQ